MGSMMVQRTQDIRRVMNKALFSAPAGRPVLVVVDAPNDLTDPLFMYDCEYPETGSMRSYQPSVKGHSGQVRKAARLLLNAKRPVIYAGGGVIQGEGSELLTELARKLNYPVTNTLMGLGAYPATDR